MAAGGCLLRFFQLKHDPLAVLKEPRAAFRQPDRARGADEEPRAQALFQHRHGARATAGGDMFRARPAAAKPPLSATLTNVWMA